MSDIKKVIKCHPKHLIATIISDRIIDVMNVTQSGAEKQCRS